MTDPISDMLTIIRNGYFSSKEEVLVPYSNLKKTLAVKLASLKFVDSVTEVKNEKGRKFIKIGLRYEKGKPEIQGLRRVSKPGLRIYKSKDKIPYVYGGLGFAILSTNQGLLTDREARKKNLGGEVICEVW
jgi:small subunit ribosomal protein S8